MLKGKKGIRIITSVVIAVIVLVTALITNRLNTEPLPEGKMQVHFVDVGQGDCTLIQTSEAVILIDAGEAGEADDVINFLKERDIKKIDCCIATHPHTDHIGGLPEIFEKFDVDTVITTEFNEDNEPTTDTYERFIDSLEYVENVAIAEVGDKYEYGSLKLEILGPLKQYEDLNNMSIVAKVSYGKTSLVLTGDAETLSENDMLENKNVDYSADILKLGHHGSSTSTGKAWLKAVNPEVGIISCGEGNKYGHPHKETVNKLKNNNIEYYRTDLKGTISFESDGEKFTLIKK